MRGSLASVAVAMVGLAGSASCAFGQQAIEWSRCCLVIHCEGVGVSEGQIEVRPIYELSDFPASPNERQGGWHEQEQAFRDGSG